MTTEMLFWVDLETTGLDPEKDQILEIAYSITDMQMNSLVDANHVFELESNPENWDPFVREMHTANDLIQDCTWYGTDPKYIWGKIYETVKSFKAEYGVERLYLAGSTIGFDSQFIKRNAPEVHALFHYRSLDVSSLKIASTMVGLELKAGDGKPHRARPDIEDSMACANIFKSWLEEFRSRCYGS